MNTPPPDRSHKGPQDLPPDPGGRAAHVARKDARLKAALKANMARRKAQVRARGAEGDNDKNDE